MKTKEKQRNGGIGILSVVFIVFLVLKLAEVGQVATWSWWWVTAPLWIPIALIVLLGFFYAVVVTFLIKK